MNIGFLKTLALTGGDWVIWGLLACSVIAGAVIIERGLLLKRELEDFAKLREALMKAKGGAPAEIVAKHHGAAGKILQTVLAHDGQGDLLLAASLEERGRLEHRLLMLGTLGNNAPFVGLFGTVLGVIKAFNDLAASSAGPEIVMQGLSEALIATAVGLFVAIPCVVAYNYYQKKVRDILSGTESLGRFLLAGKQARR